MSGTILEGFNSLIPYLFGQKEDKANNKEAMQGFFPWLITPMGEGKNAASPLQLGMTGLGLFMQNKQAGEQLEEARRQFDYQKALTGANFQNQATGWGDKALFHTLAAQGFSQNLGNQVAANYNAGFNQLNAAGNRIGINNVVGEQQNQLQKYNTLVA